MASQIGPKIAAAYELQASWMEPRLEKLGIGWTAFQMLATIHAAGEDATQIEVARRLGVSAPTLSESVKLQVKKGLVKQEPSKKDRRAKILVLTSKAETALGKIRTLVQECEQLMAGSLTDRQAKDAEVHLDKIIAALEAELSQ
jgi:DNA-binding MarR family transcriptional regulator